MPKRGLSINMSKDAFEIFLEHVHRTEQRRGLVVPPHIRSYVVALLVDFLDKPERLPDQALCELLMQAQRSRELKHVGDLCLWITGVMPDYRAHRGMTRAYYMALGRSAYGGARALVLADIAERFEPVSDYVRVLTHTEAAIPEVEHMLARFF
jgi:hypothetical protein